MANEPVVSVGEVVWQAVAVIERTAASATGANRRINSAGLEELEAVILGLVGPHEARQYSVNLNGQLMHHGNVQFIREALRKIRELLVNGLPPTCASRFLLLCETLEDLAFTPLHGPPVDFRPMSRRIILFVITQ
jgi:hypothetical protein